MKEKVCCFTGHRVLRMPKFEIRHRVDALIESLIKKGVIYYGCGGALGFDTIAAQCVLAARAKDSRVKLIMVLPCRDQDKMWSDRDKQIYAEIKAQANKVVYISEYYTKTCMHERNRHLVNESGYCISCLETNRGGTFYTYNYAIDNGLVVYNVARPDYMSPISEGERL